MCLRGAEREYGVSVCTSIHENTELTRKLRRSPEADELDIGETLCQSLGRFVHGAVRHKQLHAHCHNCPQEMLDAPVTALVREHAQVLTEYFLSFIKTVCVVQLSALAHHLHSVRACTAVYCAQFLPRHCDSRLCSLSFVAFVESIDVVSQKTLLKCQDDCVLKK